MAKKINNQLVIIAVVAIILIYGSQQGWFQPDKLNGLHSQPISQVNPSQLEYSSCSQVCSNQGFDMGYSGTNCNPGESKVIYGYTGQPPLLTCCCSDEGVEVEEEPEEYTCEEGGDSGLDEMNSGWCQDSYNNLGFVDGCESTFVVEEVFCESNNVCGTTTLNCPVYYHCENGECVDCEKAGYEFFSPVPETGSECGDWAIGYCTQFGKEYDGASFNIETKCCNWNCK